MNASRLCASARSRGDSQAGGERFAEQAVGGFVLGVVIGLESGQQGSLRRPGADVEQADRWRRLRRP